MSNISKEKFSSIEYYDNGIAIIAKTGPSTTSKIYLKNEDIQNIISRFAGYYTPQSTNTSSYDSDYKENDDEIYDAIY